MTEEKLKFLRQKAANLPRSPGIYIMKDKNKKVIYVGKSRHLKDRVSQYFHANGDTRLKTVNMVSQICDFETIVCDTEIEALALENVKIKQFTPKYNILLKDSKSYPYIKVTLNEEYPRILVTRKRLSDGAKYFGPYSGMSVVYGIINTLERSLGIPMCKRVFPRDIGKERPCIYKQLKKCVAPCDNSISTVDYKNLISLAVNILRGNIKDTVNDLSTNMFKYAEEERFEDAARCRDGIEALKRLRDSQKVVGAPDDEYDIIALYSDSLTTSVSVFYIRGGIISDSDSFVYGASEFIADENSEFMTTFLTELYSKREYIPSEIFLAFDLEEEDKNLLQEYLKILSKHSVYLKIPQKGENKKLCEMVYANAFEQAKQYRIRFENDTKILAKLSEMLSLQALPERIESYDISNLGNEHITAGMIVVENGKFKKSDYRVIKMKSQNTADDYSSMKEAISRRMLHLSDSNGSYSNRPDLILLDGGSAHVSVIKDLLENLGLSDIPVFGMVKDEHHKTRTIVTKNEEISIAKEQSVFIFISKIQDEVHRFTVSRMDSAKRKTLKKSSLESIDGIGSQKAKRVLQHFKTVSALKEASVEQISSVDGIGAKDAEKIYNYFRNK